MRLLKTQIAPEHFIHGFGNMVSKLAIIGNAISVLVEILLDISAAAHQIPPNISCFVIILQRPVRSNLEDRSLLKRD